MKKKCFILSSIFLFLLTSCSNKNNKIELEKFYARDVVKCDIKVNLPEFKENTKCYVFKEKNYAFEYNYNCLEGYNIIKEIINASDFYTAPLRNGGNHTTGLGYTFDNGYKIYFNQWKILESSKFYNDRYMFWIKTTEIDKSIGKIEYEGEPVLCEGVYKSEELFYKFFEFHEKALNNSYNKIYDESEYGF